MPLGPKSKRVAASPAFHARPRSKGGVKKTRGFCLQQLCLFIQERKFLSSYPSPVSPSTSDPLVDFAFRSHWLPWVYMDICSLFNQSLASGREIGGTDWHSSVFISGLGWKVCSPWLQVLSTRCLAMKSSTGREAWGCDGVDGCWVTTKLLHTNSRTFISQGVEVWLKLVPFFIQKESNKNLF